MARLSLLPDAGFIAGVGLGAAIAAGNFFLSVLTARFASTRAVAVATGVTLLSMGIRLTGLAVIFLLLFKSGYRFAPLLVSFVLFYTMLMGAEVIILNRERG